MRVDMRRVPLVLAVAALVAAWPVPGGPGPAGAGADAPGPQPGAAAGLTLHATQLTLPARMHAAGLDGSLVYGGLYAEGETPRAAVVDLSSRPLTARDLGTLGGEYSYASAAHGSLVAGTSRAADGTWHAFVVDLSDPIPAMTDLGALPADFSEVAGVSDRWVVGTMTRPDPSSRDGSVVDLFVVDLAAPQPQIRDVGTLGGKQSIQVTALDGGVVAGHYFTPRNLPRAFVYDAEAAQPRFVKVGPVRRGTATESDAVDVSGRLVVGATDFPGDRYRTTAFVYDVDSRRLRLIDRRTVTAAAIDGSVVVGDFATTDDDDPLLHAYVYDLAAPRPRLRDLGTPGRWSTAADVDGNLAVGVAELADWDWLVVHDLSAPDQGPVQIECNRFEDHARYTVSGRFVLTGSGCVAELGYTSAPAFALSPLRQHLKEDVGTVTFVVRRAGDIGVAASVGYRTESYEPNKHYRTRAGRDYRPVSGRLDFAPGETSKTVTVRVRDDAAPEPYECFRLRLETPSDNAVVGTPNVSELVIAPSDTPPDLWIGPTPSDAVTYVPAGYLGNNVYNRSAARQTLTQAARRGRATEFYVRLYNDGRSWSGNNNAFTLHATRPLGAAVRYHLGARDVTDALLSRRGLRVFVGTGAERPYDTYAALRVTLTPDRAAVAGDLASLLTATWKGDRVRTDAVRAVVHVS
jgi:hypothetical protein